MGINSGWHIALCNTSFGFTGSTAIGPILAVERTLAMGYDGLHMVPLHGWNYERQNEWDRSVLSYEHSRRRTSFNDTVLTLMRMRHTRLESLTDMLLYSMKTSVRYMDAKLVADYFFTPTGQNISVRVSDELDRSVKRYVDYCLEGGKICIDTQKIFKPKTLAPLEVLKFLTAKSSLLEQIPTHSIDVVLIRPREHESIVFRNFSGPTADFAKLLVKNDKVSSNAILVVDFPPFRSPRSPTILKELLIRIKWELS